MKHFAFQKQSIIHILKSYFPFDSWNKGLKPLALEERNLKIYKEKCITKVNTHFYFNINHLTRDAKLIEIAPQRMSVNCDHGPSHVTSRVRGSVP